jgi:hypothetical protein
MTGLRAVKAPGFCSVKFLSQNGAGVLDISLLKAKLFLLFLLKIGSGGVILL